MLTDQELQRAFQSLVDDWQRTYPTPWPLLRWLDSIQTSNGGGVDLWGKFIKSILPSPEWFDWFIKTAMYIGYQKWGHKFCFEELERIHASLQDRAKRPDSPQWLYEQDERIMEMMRAHWFPDWQPPHKAAPYFPSKGLAQQPAPTKDIFR